MFNKRFSAFEGGLRLHRCPRSLPAGSARRPLQDRRPSLPRRRRGKLTAQTALQDLEEARHFCALMCKVCIKTPVYTGITGVVRPLKLIFFVTLSSDVCCYVEKGPHKILLSSTLHFLLQRTLGNCGYWGFLFFQNLCWLNWNIFVIVLLFLCC